MRIEQKGERELGTDENARGGSREGEKVARLGKKEVYIYINKNEVVVARASMRNAWGICTRVTRKWFSGCKG